ncbi:MAG: hypothetical protein QQN48_02510, partial [Nitrosopumilus sp.]
MQFPSEFIPNRDIEILFEENNLLMGRMIGGSKSSYMKLHSKDTIVFNANIIIESKGKIWHGDLNVTEDYEKLEKISNGLDEHLYILREMDARFGDENESIDKLIKKAIVKI